MYLLCTRFAHDLLLSKIYFDQYSMSMYFKKFLSTSDVSIILTSNKGLFSRNVSYQLVMDLTGGLLMMFIELRFIEVYFQFVTMR
jgi:hypothetical protein